MSSSSSSLRAAAVALLWLTAAAGQAAEEPKTAATWEALSAQSSEPSPPERWRQERPSREEVEKWKGPEAARLATLAEQIHLFLEKHPQDANRYAAEQKQSEALAGAYELGLEEAAAKIDALDRQRLADPKEPLEMRLGIRARQVQKVAEEKFRQSPAEGRALFMEGMRTLAKEFPGRPEPYGMMLQVASDEDGLANRATLEDIVASSAPEEIKNTAKATLNRWLAVGQPLTLKFTALDGHPVDLAALKGKVVLIDFWATWCGPCVAAMPEVKATYEKLHAQGFEVIGINLDEEKASVEEFTHSMGLPWPQYFDGLRWENKVARQYGILGIPSMWLVDRQGVLRDVNVAGALVEKVDKLMAEKL